MHQPQVSRVGLADRFQPQAHREPGLADAGQWRVVHAAQRPTIVAMWHLKPRPGTLGHGLMIATWETA
jgi:hypothetical protein